MNSILKRIIKLTLGKKFHNIPSLTEFRLSQCRQCNFFEKQDSKCSICGCFMDIKAQMETNINPITRTGEITHCPKGKWGDEIIANLYK